MNFIGIAFSFYVALLLPTLISGFDREEAGANGKLVQEDPCILAPESGFCYAYFPSFYYDAEADKCKPFVYGGCGGNSNRFETEKECGKFRHRCLRKHGKGKPYRA